jgi:hypothetical protein
MNIQVRLESVQKGVRLKGVKERQGRNEEETKVMIETPPRRMDLERGEESPLENS